MKTADLVIAVNTVWVVLAAVLVMFMQAGFAFLEAGLTRMKNAAHIAGKNVLIFGVCSIVYWAVGFGIAFGDGNSVIGTSGFFPSTDELLSIGAAPFSFGAMRQAWLLKARSTSGCPSVDSSQSKTPITRGSVLWNITLAIRKSP